MTLYDTSLSFNKEDWATFSSVYIQSLHLALFSQYSLHTYILYIYFSKIMPFIDQERLRNMLQRFPILLATLASLIPLCGLINFDTNWVDSVAFIVIYLAICLIELVLLFSKKKLSPCELYVYSVMLICTFVITTVYFQDRYNTGKDTKQEFIWNMMGVIVAVVAEIYQVIRDLRSFDRRG